MKRLDWPLALLLLAALSAAGESCRAGDTLSKLLACRDLTDASARLACFDRESAALASAPAAPAAPVATLGSSGAASAVAPAAVTPARAVPPPDPKQQFGLPEREVAKQEVAAGARAPDADKIEARIVALAMTGDGRAVLTLDNNQVWRQLSADTDLFVKPGDSVTISRAFLGSYWIETPTRRGCKVTRVR